MANNNEAIFEFTDVRGDKFNIKLDDERRIKFARDILSGAEKNKVHVFGRISKRTEAYNPKWSFHMDPKTIDFFDMAIEVCDSSTNYLEDHLDEACGAFLPGCFWCPWTSKLTREISSSKK